MLKFWQSQEKLGLIVKLLLNVGVDDADHGSCISNAFSDEWS